MFIVLPNPFLWMASAKSCQEGWRCPALYLFTKVFDVFSCTLPKVAFSRNFLLTRPGFCGSLSQQFNIYIFLLIRSVPAGLGNSPFWLFKSLHNRLARPSEKAKAWPVCFVATFLLPFQPRTLKTAWPSAWDTRRWPRKGEPENAAGRGQEIHAGRTANHCYHDSTFCQVEVNLASIDFNTHHNKSSGQNDHLIFPRYFWKLERFFPK